MYLIRHGQTDWNDEGRYQGRTDSTLDAIGQAQAARLAAALSRALLTAVYTSALSRARATAEAIAAPHALPIIVVEQLGEVALGAWEGMTAAEIREQFGPDVLDRRLEDPHFAPPGGETLAALQARALRAVREIVGRHPGETVAVVAHGAINKTIVLAVLGAPLTRSRSFRQSNGAINVLEFDGPRARVLLLNETAHLEDLAPGERPAATE